MMADKIKTSYKFSKSFYDDAITQGKWWSKLYFKLLWGGVDDNDIARRVLSWIPDDFKGRLLDVPVGTAVFTTEKYRICIEIVANDVRPILPEFTAESIGIDAIIAPIAMSHHNGEIFAPQTGTTEHLTGILPMR